MQSQKSTMTNPPAPRFLDRLKALGTSLVSAGNPAVRHLEQQLREKEATIAEQVEALAQGRRIFNRAAEAARIGIWQCSLPDETLTWTDVVYDIFDLPRDLQAGRAATLACYTPSSAKELQEKRRLAIETRSGFTMDAEIVTQKGNHRWVRITATVECEGDEPVRIFGIKQDITDAKLLFDRTRHLADFDMMTGLANRAQFQLRLAALCEEHDRSKAPAALLLVDLDGFKAVNDTYGHATGDACLIEAAERLRAVCSRAHLIARIGGDEFAVLLEQDAERGTVNDIANDIVQIVRRPMILGDLLLNIGASVGVALADGSGPSELFQRADTALYAAKAAGRNTFSIFEPSERQTLCAPRSAA
ncbi:sensor domain-containing diguanylate cyclase [Rhizobium tumorigenes]|uniref:sensor domain-containing diguanylate cyclase n=1 Tax=Rhizobium tumorigenes TaxID=2041385 RepID=UPI00241F3747|nr:sensor domain-containing diguanylate cyclase [Rhizobium tumorigenes]WFS00329.1 sensor domain-containing diguanylate cyclase [Rhizobium tumorigenes]